MAVDVDAKPYCTCTQIKGTTWVYTDQVTVVHSPCGKVTIAAWASKVNGVYIQYHVFTGGPLPDDTAHALRVVVGPDTRNQFTGYEPTDELKTSTTNPDVSARVWRWNG